MPAPYISAPSALGNLGDRLLGFGQFLMQDKERKGVELARQREEALRRSDQETEFVTDHGGGVGAVPTIEKDIPGTGTGTDTAGIATRFPPPSLEEHSILPAAKAPGIGIQAGQTGGMGIAAPPLPKPMDAPEITGRLAVTENDPRYRAVHVGGIDGYVRTPESMAADKELEGADKQWGKLESSRKAVASLRPDLGTDQQEGVAQGLASDAIPSIPMPAKPEKPRYFEKTDEGGVVHRVDEDTLEDTPVKGFTERVPGSESGKPPTRAALAKQAERRRAAIMNQGPRARGSGKFGTNPESPAEFQARVRSELDQSNQEFGFQNDADYQAALRGQDYSPPSIMTQPRPAPDLKAQYRDITGLSGAGARTIPPPQVDVQPKAKTAPAAAPNAAPAADKAPISKTEAAQLRARGWSDTEIQARYTVS